MRPGPLIGWYFVALPCCRPGKLVYQAGTYWWAKTLRAPTLYECWCGAMYDFWDVAQWAKSDAQLRNQLRRRRVSHV